MAKIKSEDLAQIICEILIKNNNKPMVAYDILEKLKFIGINAPPTVYRALEKLVKTGQVHRLVSNHSYFLSGAKKINDNESLVFHICNSCGQVNEVYDHALYLALRNIQIRTGFEIENEILEFNGKCNKECSNNQLKASA
jgi:Fur family transcriptional regulator, zinc uptake regulator